MKILLEAAPGTIDLRALFSATQQNGTPVGEKPDNTTAPEKTVKETSSNVLPEKYNWGWWKAEFKRRQEENKAKSPQKRKSDYDIEYTFFKDFFETNWEEASSKQLLAIGEPLRRAFKVLGFNPKQEANGNPIFAFIRQGYVQKYLLQTGLLNANTFKAIYNAVAKKLVSDSEFFNKNDYNIIYCKNLYKKPPTEIEKYLELQSQVLLVSSEEYSVDLQERNKKIFLYIDTIEELEPAKRAEKVNSLSESPVKSVTGAELNSIKLATIISGKKELDKVHLDTAGQDKLIDQIKENPAKLFVTLLSLSLSTTNKTSADLLKNGAFSQLTASEIAEATLWLDKNNVVPKGQLQDADADALVSKLAALIVKRQ